MDSPKEEDAPVFLNRSSRSTRGKRMTKLLDKEIEEDELFWNQDALQEDEADNVNEEEPEVADEFDSDFNEDESIPEEEAENEADERTQTKKRLIFTGKTSSKNKKKKRAVSKFEKPSIDEAWTDTEVERTVRKSTRTSVIVRQAEMDAIRAVLQATMKSNIPNPNLFIGAVVGGPDITDSYTYSRVDFIYLEPTTYNSAPLVGLLAYFKSHST